MKNLMNIVSDVVSGDVLDGIADLVDADRSTAGSAVSKFAPAIIGGLIDKGSSQSGAQNLLDFIKSNNFGDQTISGLSSIFGNTESAAEYMNDGMGVLEYIFGDNFNGILDKIVGMSGLDRAGGSTMIKFLAPIVMGKLGGLVSSNNWGATRLSEFLNDQKKHIDGLVPGIAKMLGFAYAEDSTDRVAATSSTAAGSTATRVDDDTPADGSSWWKWLIPLLILALAVYMLTKDGCGEAVVEDEETEEVMDDTDMMEEPEDIAITTPEVTIDDDIDVATIRFSDNGDLLDADGNVIVRNGDYAMDANGNIINNNGTVIIRANDVPASLKTKVETHLGKYRGTRLSVDADGNLINADGEIIYRSGEYEVRDGFYYDKEGTRLGRIWEDIKDAVSNTVESMRDFFMDMFEGKPGVESTYLLTDMEFDRENHRIVNYSKAEVEGLARALKANEDSRIEVMVYTNDGKDDNESKELSEKRANVVHDQLVTLGVDKGQISFSGKGTEDARKAADDRVEIKVVE